MEATGTEPPQVRGSKGAFIRFCGPPGHAYSLTVAVRCKHWMYSTVEVLPLASIELWVHKLQERSRSSPFPA